MPRALMLQGTASGVGKSVLCAGLARVFARRGVRVVPFKAQNIALNAAICADGGEIGRAQALQARAAGLEPTTALNPLLLKASGDTCQVIVRGTALSTAEAEAFWADRSLGWQAIASAYAEASANADLMLIEGAGSPAEINLADRDWTNMRLADYADAAVLLVGDIDRGGVFAHLRGTLDWLDEQDRARVKGLVINRLRGDVAGLQSGIARLEQVVNVPVVGVVPMLADLGLPDEDGLALEQRLAARALSTSESRPGSSSDSSPVHTEILVIRLPHLSNFDEFLEWERRAGYRVHYVTEPSALPELAHAGVTRWLVLPGTKATRADLEWLRAKGWPAAIQAVLDAGGHILGVCGGLQMLGRTIRDEAGIEGPPGLAEGLGLLPLETEFGADKVTRHLRTQAGREVDQIQHGRVLVDADAPGFAPIELQDGAREGWATGRVWGTSLHGAALDLPELARGATEAPAYDPAALDRALERWADHVEAHLDWRVLDALSGLA